MLFPEIDALARAAAGDIPSPTDPQIAALFAALGGGWWNASGAVATEHSP